MKLTKIFIKEKQVFSVEMSGKERATSFFSSKGEGNDKERSDITNETNGRCCDDDQTKKEQKWENKEGFYGKVQL